MTDTSTAVAEQERLQSGVLRVLFIEGAVNLLALLAKVTVGLSTGSVALLSDAMHSATDLVNNGLAIAAARISAEPPDSDHPYGHRKFEPLAVFGLAMLLSVVAVQIALHAVTRGSHPIDTSAWGMALMVGVLAMNIGIAIWEALQAARLDSDLLRADATHTFSDIMTTVVVIAAWQLGAYGWYWLDSALAILVAALVFYLAYGLFRRAVPILVDQAVADPREVIRTVGAIPDVHEVRRVRSRESGTGAAADVVVAVDGTLSTERSHEIANTIEDALERTLGIHDVTVHVEPARPRNDKEDR